MLFAGKWMELRIMLSEISYLDKHCKFLLICRISVYKKEDMRTEGDYLGRGRGTARKQENRQG
jgi:hypothetical protein